MLRTGILTLLPLLVLMGGAQEEPTPPTPPVPSPPPTTQPAAPAEKSPYVQGPLRVELMAILEGRYHYFDESMAQKRDSELRMQFRVAGENIGQIVRYGSIVLEDVVDAEGNALVDPATITDEARTTTRLSTMAPERIEESGLLLVAQSKASARTAQTLRHVRGFVRCVFSTGYEEITVLNPLQYLGKKIENPRLEALGVEIEMQAAPGPDANPPANQQFTLCYKRGGDRIRTVNVFDQWMKVIRNRATPSQGEDGRECMQFRLLGGEVDDHSQLVIQIFADAREEVVKFDLPDVKLP